MRSVQSLVFASRPSEAKGGEAEILSQVCGWWVQLGSCRELRCGGEGVEHFAVGGGGCFESARGVFGGGEFGQAGGQDAVVDGGEEFRGVQAVVGDPVAVGARDAGDQAAGSESA